VDNQYARAVTREGNPHALHLIREVFEVTETKWRGIGPIPEYLANEGKLIAVAPPADAERVLSATRRNLLGRDAATIGEIVAQHPGFVTPK
jgi:hydrogenase expression/formation protein HypD